MTWLPLTVYVSVALAWGGFIVGSVKWLLDKHFAGLDRRFQTLEAVQKAEAEGWRRLERDLLELKAELPTQYVRREDWIRLATSIEAKMDTLAAKIDELKGRLYDRGSR